MTRSTSRRIDRLAVVAGAIRLTSGLSFLIAPAAANRFWGDAQDSGPTASLLLRSMGYRDALIGASCSTRHYVGSRPPRRGSWPRPVPTPPIFSADSSTIPG